MIFPSVSMIIMVLAQSAINSLGPGNAFTLVLALVLKVLYVETTLATAMYVAFRVVLLARARVWPQIGWG
jgi:hypothetical protein